VEEQNIWEASMAVSRPNIKELQQAALELGLRLSEDDAASFHKLMQAQLDAYDLVDAMVAPLPEVKYPRTRGFRPQPSENPFGAWAVQTRIEGARGGKLSGKRIAIKDNVCVAGVPMMNGSSILEGYVPEIDATIVTRLLDAGGEILGKAVCEYYCASGGSHTSASSRIPWCRDTTPGAPHLDLPRWSLPT
jgi:amidase